MGAITNRSEKDAEVSLFSMPTQEELAKLAKAQPSAPAPARRGRLGSCRACKQSVASHWDSAGQWLGCPAVSPDTVFVLWPVSGISVDGDGEEPAAGGQPQPHKSRANKSKQKDREFNRARYHTLLPADTDMNTLGFTGQRLTVFQSIHEAGPTGCLARDIIKRTKLPNNAVQDAARWLRDQQKVKATEDAPKT